MLVTFCRYAKLYSLAEPDRQRGAITYSEVTFWTFMATARDLSPRLPRGRICVFIPYLFVDNHYAMAGGRESLGLPKNMGAIAMPGSPHDPACYALSAIASTGRPARSPVCCRSLTCKKPDRAPVGDMARDWASFDDLVDGVVGLHVGRGEGRALSRLAVEVGGIVEANVAEATVLDVALAAFPVVALRQFRSGADPERASAQSILTFGATIRPPLHGGLIFHNFDVSFNPCASHPIAAELGLADSQRAVGAFRASFGMDVSLTSNLWAPPS